jgi:hypothetical protein
MQILGGGHDGELNGTLVAKGLVGPFPHGTDLLDGGDTVVGDEDLEELELAELYCGCIFLFVFSVLLPTTWTFTYRGNDGVTAMFHDEILHTARGCLIQAVAADEM